MRSIRWARRTSSGCGGGRGPTAYPILRHYPKNIEKNLDSQRFIKLLVLGSPFVRGGVSDPAVTGEAHRSLANGERYVSICKDLVGYAVRQARRDRTGIRPP